MHVYRKFEFIIDNRKFAFWFLATVGVCLIGLYWVFIGQAVYHVAERQEVDRDIDSLSSKVSVLESRYITAVSGITIEKSLELGFVEPEDVIYVGKKALTEVALKNN